MLDKSFDVHLNNNKNSRQHYIYEKKGLWNVCNILVRKWNVIVFLPCQFEKKVTISYHRHFDRNRIYFKNYLLRFIWEFGVESFIPCRMSLIFSNIVASSTCKMHWAQSFNSLTILAQNLLQTPPRPVSNILAKRRNAGPATLRACASSKISALLSRQLAHVGGGVFVARGVWPARAITLFFKLARTIHRIPVQQISRTFQDLQSYSRSFQSWKMLK